MPTLSAFADEISPELTEQLDVLAACGITHVDLRSVWKTNVMDLTDDQLRQIKKMMDDRGVKLAAVGSPIGKSTIDKPASYELDRVKRAADIAQSFGATYIRVFSFYAPEGKSIADYGKEVLNRLAGWVRWVQDEKRPVVLTHENEEKIYGDIPERCEQIMRKFYGRQFVNCYDPANWVHIGLTDVYKNCWLPMRKYTKFFHLKDYKIGKHVVPCGQGDADVGRTLADAYKDGFDGFMTLEPHLSTWGQFAGFTGPDLFKKAVQAVRDLCQANGIPLN